MFIFFFCKSTNKNGDYDLCQNLHYPNKKSWEFLTKKARSKAGYISIIQSKKISWISSAKDVKTGSRASNTGSVETTCSLFSLDAILRI